MMPFIAWPGRTLLGMAVAIAAGAVLQPAAAEAVRTNARAVAVHVDQARLIKTPANTATLVIGNPLIADVSAQPGGVLVVTGKSYGVTNIIALDRDGAVLMERYVEVQGPAGNVVLVYRGVDRESYSCTPDCERRITLGDTPNYFNATLNQSGTLNTQAMGTAQPPK